MISANLACAFLQILVASIGDDDAARARFVNEYPAASATLERQLSEWKGRARIRPVTGSRRGGGTLVAFAVDDDRRKIELDVATKKSRSTFVYVVTDHGAFQLSRSSPDRPFQINGMGLDPKSLGDFDHQFGKYLTAPWAVVGVPIREWMKLPNYRLLDVQASGTGAEEVAEVEFEAGEFHGRPNLIRLRLDPNRGWAVLRSEFLPGGSKVSPTLMEIEYADDDAEGRARPRRIHHRALDRSEEICEFEQVEFAPTPESEFQMRHYGLKDVAGRSTGGRSFPYEWLAAFGCGLGLLGVGIWLKRRAEH